MRKQLTTADLPQNYQLDNFGTFDLPRIAVIRPDGEYLTGKYGCCKQFASVHLAVAAARRSENGLKHTYRHCSHCGTWYGALEQHTCQPLQAYAAFEDLAFSCY